MASPKKSNFSPDVIQVAEFAKALSHPARIRILQILTESDSCIMGSIVDQLPLAQATVSQHLKALKESGLIKGEIDGPKVCYCLDKQVLQIAKRTFDSLFTGTGCCKK